MKLGAKIFLYITIFFSVAFLAGGYVLISYFYEITMEREIESAVEQYQYNKFVIQAHLITKGTEWFEGAAGGNYDIGSAVSDMNDTVAIFSTDGLALVSEFPAETEFSGLLEDVIPNKISYQFMKIRDKTYLLTAGVISHADTSVYLVTGTDVESVLKQYEQIIEKFGMVYGVTIGVGSLLIFGLSSFLTKPVKQLTYATKKIADGNYKERVAEGGRDEVGQLARNFNRMASAVEEKIQELSDGVRQREDFVANFAHELKTPLTSIIGYADRIYHKEMPREEQKQAAWYIWNEGMRLESLSLKLMDMTVLNHKDFILQEMNAQVLFQELTNDVKYLMNEKGVSFQCSVEGAYIDVEYDLFKTLFLNLIDNSIKAGATNIRVEGGRYEKDYVIQVCDNGSGIPAQEIKRITEAFYMVDKSRSRKQHGAGIGLALAEKIVQIHGGTLGFESDGSSWTKVGVRLRCRGAVDDEEK
ncbi:MAG: HAMP domain-containing histidine kinase [Lachnospiraceae bacterium]|nr:HAMP domain-containing histidine kinase [Lachnospiraceae bacterium]